VGGDGSERGSARVPRLEFSDVRQLHPVVIVPPDRFRSFVHIHHALVGHPRSRCAHLSNLVRFPPDPVCPSPVLALSPAEPWSRSERLRAREPKRNALRCDARSAAIGLANDGAWPPRHAA